MQRVRRPEPLYIVQTFLKTLLERRETEPKEQDERTDNIG